MKDYTVIAVRDATGDVVQRQAKAADRYAAMLSFARFFHGDTDLQILGAIEGNVTIMPPAEEARTSYASDVAHWEG